MFTKELIQAISNWQIGSSKERGEKLKSEALKLPDTYRKTDAVCYRRIDLNDPALRYLGTEYQLPEKISSWSRSALVAKKFNMGVPRERSRQGLIFSVQPSPATVIVDLTLLFDDPAFQAARNEYESQIVDYTAGMGRWGNTEKEVVIELEFVPLDSMCFWGGYSSSAEELITQYLQHFGRTITVARRKQTRRLMKRNRIVPGPWWLSDPEGLARAAAKLKYLSVAIPSS